LRPADAAVEFRSALCQATLLAAYRIEVRPLERVSSFLDESNEVEETAAAGSRGIEKLCFIPGAALFPAETKKLLPPFAVGSVGVCPILPLIPLVPTPRLCLLVDS
jgi:hypothetical protein